MEHLNRLRTLNDVMVALEALGVLVLAATVGFVGLTQPLGSDELWLVGGVTGGAAVLIVGLIAGFLVAAGGVEA